MSPDFSLNPTKQTSISELESKNGEKFDSVDELFEDLDS
ncbi:hypothetical protein MNB_SM-4-721 [hydrothermal vent metagenome]|uniref:Uncharacterized protein n=1 Tax=hydrothermal vent metagenome TaxID=652676 RepID=A0A1W1CPG6_9ZZZZ